MWMRGTVLGGLVAVAACALMVSARRWSPSGEAERAASVAPDRTLVGSPTAGAVSVAAEPNPEDTQRARFWELARFDPAGALERARALADVAERGRMLRMIAETWAELDPAATLAWLAANGDSALVEQVLPTINDCLQRGDARAVVAQLSRLPASALRENVLATAIVRWSDEHFDAALQWALQLPAGERQAHALAHLGGRWLEIDAAAAMACAEQLRGSAPQLAERLATEWAARDGPAAWAWADGITDNTARARIRAGVTATWAQHAPRDAAQRAHQLPPGPERSEAIATVLMSWTLAAPVEAAVWAEQFAAGELAPMIYGQLALAWARRDATAAGQWALQMSPGQWSDAALSGFCDAVGAQQPAMAFTFAGLIARDDVRAVRLEEAARRWLQSDPVAARTKIAQSELPALARARLAQAFPAP